MAFEFGSVDPGIGQLAAVKNIQRFEDANQQRDSRQLVLIERLLPAALQLIVDAVRDATEELARAASSRTLQASIELEERRNAGTAETFLNLLAREIRSAVGRKAGDRLSE